MSTPLIRTEPEPLARAARIARSVAGAGLILLIFLALAGNVLDLLKGRLDLFPVRATWARFWDGEVTAGISGALSKATVPAKAAHLQRGMGWSVLADLGPRVRMGCPGWWFLKDELAVHPQGRGDALKRADVVARVQHALMQRGIRLLVVVVPDKSRMERANLCSLGRPASLDDRLQVWMAALAQRGVDAIDLQETLAAVPRKPDGTAAFLRSDTHWNEAGALAAAAVVAERVRAAQVPLVPHQAYDVRYRAAAARWGDLYRLAGLEGWPWMRGVRPDMVSEPVFTAVDEAASTADSADDLFGDAELPTLALVGTSYSNTSHFAGHIESLLQTRIGNFARDGGDFSGSARGYFLSAAFEQTPPALVIWEMPERVLQMPGPVDDVGLP